jgi:hypothetical protein
MYHKFDVTGNLLFAQCFFFEELNTAREVWRGWSGVRGRLTGNGEKGGVWKLKSTRPGRAGYDRFASGWAYGAYSGCIGVVCRKKSIQSLNFRESLLQIPELQNQAKHILTFYPQLLKPFVLRPWAVLDAGLLQWRWLLQWPCFYLFLFYLFRLNLWKIIVNHRKIIK